VLKRTYPGVPLMALVCAFTWILAIIIVQFQRDRSLDGNGERKSQDGRQSEFEHIKLHGVCDVLQPPCRQTVLYCGCVASLLLSHNFNCHI
jgi:hypothetical protein